MAKKKNRKKNPPKPNAPKNKATKPAAQPATARQAAAKRRKPGAASRGRRGGKVSPTASWAMLVGGIALIVGAILFFAIRSQSDNGTGEVAAGGSGFDLPALAGDADDDGRILLSDFQGTPTVVNFFASWCIECNRELPAFTALADELEGEVDFVFVNSQETGNWESMANDHGLQRFPIARDIGASGSQLYGAVGGTGGMPITAFYDANGNRVFTNPGGMNTASLSSTLAQYDLLP